MRARAWERLEDLEEYKLGGWGPVRPLLFNKRNRRMSETTGERSG